MNLKKAEKLELLSPVGSLEAFFAAMESGADAVYAGPKEFSARAKAKNFTLQELERMTGYAHARQRKLYVTLNTLVKERELPALAETLAALEGMAVDGIILQDLAVWRLARRHFPGLELHASTQMTIHNAAGVRMLERMGFTRGVLARELTLEEIANLRRQTTLELEHFIHGALCFSFSGQCFFSSWLGGKSGNRGRCAQPCRRRYRYRQNEGYYFSTNDLSAIDLLPELADAGVMSFKIEGRMKSAEYVSNVVSAYRRVLDASPALRPQAVKEAKDLLKSSFGRTPTRGFLPGDSPADIAIPSLKGSTGRFLGEVAQVKEGEISFKTRDRLHVGDRLRIQPKSDQPGTAFTIKELRQGRRPVKRVDAGAYVSVPSPFRDIFRVGDTVFKVSSDQAFTMSEAACRRKLDKAATRPVSVRLMVTMPDNATLSIQGVAGDITLTRDYEIETFPATDRPLSTATLKGVFERTAGEPFILEQLEAAKLPPLVIPPSRLKEIRRDFYGGLRKMLHERSGVRRSEHLHGALSDLLPVAQGTGMNEKSLSVVIRDIRDAHILNDSAIDRVLLPLTAGNIQGLGRAGKRLTGKEDRMVWDLPFILFDSEWNEYREAVKSLFRRGYKKFRLNNLGHFPLFDGIEGVELIASYRLFSVNSQALLAWKELGAGEATLYIEDDKDNLRQILQRECGLNLALTVYGSIPLITSRIPIRGVRPDTPVLSDRNDAYRVNQRAGLTVITPDVDFSLLGRLGEIQAMGCVRFVLDLTHLGPFSPAGKKILDSLRRGSEVPGTSSFNFDTGME